jgi:hypothetical protein
MERQSGRAAVGWSGSDNCFSTVLPFYRSTVLPFYRSTVLPFYRSAALPFYCSLW